MQTVEEYLKQFTRRTTWEVHPDSPYGLDLEGVLVPDLIKSLEKYNTTSHRVARQEYSYDEGYHYVIEELTEETDEQFEKRLSVERTRFVNTRERELQQLEILKRKYESS